MLRTAGAKKRANLDEVEGKLLYKTLRDLNMSKFVAQDMPLFKSLVKDIFPTLQEPPADR